MRTKREPASKSDLAFAMLPYEFVASLRLRARMEESGARLSPFELSILCGVLRLATTALAQVYHAAGMAGGAREIADEVAAYPGYKPKNHDSEIQRRGKRGYVKDKALAKQAVAEPVVVRCTAWELLRSARMSGHGTNFAALAAALDRLRRGIWGTKGERFPAPLIAAELTDSRLRLTVRPFWLPGKAFTRVPLPLPSRSAPALALFLFLRTIKTGPNNTKSSELATVYSRLRIDTSEGKQSNALKRAVSVVNKYLAGLDRLALHVDCQLFLPPAYELSIVAGRIRFVDCFSGQPAKLQVEKQAAKQQTGMIGFEDAEKEALG